MTSSKALLALIHSIRDGLIGNRYYADLTAIVTSLTASEDTLLDLLDTVTTLEQQLKTIRAAVATELLNGKEKLRAAAVACENTDRSDEALVSAGWSLRRPAGPTATMPAPLRLAAQCRRLHRRTERALDCRAQQEVLRSAGHPARWVRQCRRLG